MEAVAVWPVRFSGSEKFQETRQIALPCLFACNNSKTGERIFRNLMFCVKNIFENATSVDTDVECYNTFRKLAGFCLQHTMRTKLATSEASTNTWGVSSLTLSTDGGTCPQRCVRQTISESCIKNFRRIPISVEM
jgi:hypothetical protein